MTCVTDTLRTWRNNPHGPAYGINGECIEHHNPLPVIQEDYWSVCGFSQILRDDAAVHEQADTMIVIPSPRLQFSQFQMTDAPEVFGCITPAIAKFMPWEPPSWSEYVARCEKRVQAPEPNNFSFVIRRRDNSECLGMASLEGADSVSPELGLWLKESAHGQGFGREVVAALVAWGHATLGKESFIYPVAVLNTASRRIAENLHGEIIGKRTNPKYDSVVYRIPFRR